LIIDLLYPSGPPTKAELPTGHFVKLVKERSKRYCKERGIPAVDCSRDSIERAAGRKK
jgi:hypothetical protein